MLYFSTISTLFENTYNHSNQNQCKVIAAILSVVNPSSAIDCTKYNIL